MQADQTVLNLTPCGGTHGGGNRVFGPRLDSSAAANSDLPLLRPHGGVSASSLPSFKMVGGNRSRRYYFRRCKTNMESLPDDVLLEIIVHLPAEDIYDPAMLVCRKWYHMIRGHNFIYAHLQRTDYGLLFHRVNNDSLFMALRQGRIEISKFKYKFKCRNSGSCNGLMLVYKSPKFDTLYIANPVTKQTFPLPPVPEYALNYSLCGIAYAAASFKYKVVIAFPPSPNSKGFCRILTVGVDNSWRNVRCDHLSDTAEQAFLWSPLITEGFLHWHCCWRGNQVLTLNVETEIITSTSPPIPEVVYGHRRFYFSTGRYLSLLITSGEFLWEVWEMEPETGEWRKLRNIDLEARKGAFERFAFKHDEFLVPIGWLRYLEVLVFGVSGAVRPLIFPYNLLTQEIDSIELRLPTSRRDYRILLHRSSLLGLGGCGV